MRWPLGKSAAYPTTERVIATRLTSGDCRSRDMDWQDRARPQAGASARVHGMNRFHRWYCRTDHWRSVVQQELLPWVLGETDLGAHALEVGPGPGLTTDVLRAR